MGKKVIVYTCSHADPSVSSERFKYLSDFIWDIRPDYVVDLGDGADMRSLNSYDTRYPQAIVSQNYEADIEAYNKAQDILWGRYKSSKKKRPFRVGFEGNHENRIKKVIAQDPRLEGSKFGVSFSHLQTDHWFDEYHEYENSGPAMASYDGVLYSHYFTSGNSSTAMSGLHHSYNLVQTLGCSVTCGHSHKRSVYFKDGSHPHPKIGLVAGCYKGSDESWAGQSNNSWWKGVVLKQEVANGFYEPMFVSFEMLKKEYQ